MRESRCNEQLNVNPSHTSPVEAICFDYSEAFIRGSGLGMWQGAQHCQRAAAITQITGRQLSEDGGMHENSPACD
jgi:hypothetical protein